MIDSVDFTHEGKEYSARLNIGALESVKIENFAPDVTFGALVNSVHTLEELTEILRAVFTSNDLPFSHREFIDRSGLTAARKLAVNLFVAAYGPIPKKDDAPPIDQSHSE